MADELSKGLSLMTQPNGQHKMAKMLIAMAKLLEGQNAIGHQIDKKIYNDVAIEFGFHGADDYHGHERSSHYIKMQGIAEGMFFADMRATTNTAFNNRAGGVTTSLDWERAEMESYPQFARLEQFFPGATDEQAAAIKRLGDKISTASPKSARFRDRQYGMVRIQLDRDFRTGKYKLISNVSYYDGNRYQFNCPDDGPYVISELWVHDDVDLGGRSVADMSPAELEQFIFYTLANLANKTDDKLQEKETRQLSMDEQIERGFAPKPTIADDIKKAILKITGILKPQNALEK